MNQKKGVSPLIAVVLLIVFTVAVSTMIMSWMNTYTKTTTTSASANTDTVITCSQQTVNIPTTGVVYNSTGNVVVNIENNGQINTTIKKVLAYDKNGVSCDLGLGDITLEVGDIVNNITNCYTQKPAWDNCTASVRATTTCGGIYDEWTNSVTC